MIVVTTADMAPQRKNRRVMRIRSPAGLRRTFATISQIKYNSRKKGVLRKRWCLIIKYNSKNIEVNLEQNSSCILSG
jgi:hypothetical protein